ncbi:MAG TPA: L-fucose:H+ symporter permease [Paludibacter sp.]|nr:L-fucose:H+ symporter permease [Paludibacter sp.]
MSQKVSIFQSEEGKSYLVPFILVTSLFFLWGFAHSLLDVLNKHFQDILHVSRAQSGLVQAAVYGGYFLAAIPAGIFMKKFGYKKGIILGLLLYAFGAFLFFPAVHIQQFWAFLTALFIIALGLTCLETAANPYSTILGPTKFSAQRLTLSQSFNGVGWILGPLVGSLVLFGATDPKADPFASLAIPYVGIGVVVLLLALFFTQIKMPEINEAVVEHVEYTEVEESNSKIAYKSLFHYKHFIWAVVAQFFYVAAQTGINSFFINYVFDIFKAMETRVVLGHQFLTGVLHLIGNNGPLNDDLYKTASGIILAICGMGLFTIGRFAGSAMLVWFKPNRLLTVFALSCMALTVIVILGLGALSIIALCSIYFFMSIMFPVNFALGLRNLGSHTKRASSFLVMAIVGGAIFPALMGYIADKTSMQVGFFVPLFCFFIVFLFGARGYKIKSAKA